MEVMNQAMDMEVVSAELRDLIDTLLGRRETLPRVSSRDGGFGSGDGGHGNSGHFTSSPHSPHVVQLIMPKQLEEGVTFSCPPLSLMDSPLLESPTEASPVEDVGYCRNSCLNEVTEILSEVHPILFNSRNEEHQHPQQCIQQDHPIEVR